MLRYCLSLLLFFATTSLAQAERVGFEDVPGLPYYEGPLAAPRLNKAECHGEEFCFWHFRTALREGAGEGINFNGAFTVVTWGCGTSCQTGGVIDRTDGKVYPLPVASFEYEFRTDSALLIVNPAIDSEDPMFGEVEREFYRFAHGRFILIGSDSGDDALETAHPIRPEALEEIEDDVTAEACAQNDELCPE